MNYYEAIIVRAFQATLEPDNEAFLRRVKRYYSKNFNVPLPAVDDLDEEHVLQTFWEDRFDEMTEAERAEFHEHLAETDEEREERARSESKAEDKDEEFLDNLNKEVLSGTLKGPPKARRPQWKPRAKTVKPKEAPKPPEPVPAAEPDIHMSFEGDGNLEGGGVPSAWLDMDPLSPPPRK